MQVRRQEMLGIWHVLAPNPCCLRLYVALICAVQHYSLHCRHKSPTCDMAGWAECIDTARYQFELGNYEMALDAYKACIADLNKVIRNSTDNAMRNKAIEVSIWKSWKLLCPTHVCQSCYWKLHSWSLLYLSLYCTSACCFRQPVKQRFLRYCTLPITVRSSPPLVLMLLSFLLCHSHYNNPSLHSVNCSF